MYACTVGQYNVVLALVLVGQQINVGLESLDGALHLLLILQCQGLLLAASDPQPLDLLKPVSDIAFLYFALRLQLADVLLHQLVLMSEQSVLLFPLGPDLLDVRPPDKRVFLPLVLKTRYLGRHLLASVLAVSQFLLLHLKVLRQLAALRLTNIS